MDLFKKKFKCEQCDTKFKVYEDLINHARHEHHHDIVKCETCGKEFIHEADRLHHSREEHQKKMEGRIHKSDHKHDKSSPSPQDDVDAHTSNFGDKL
ncbi:MAG: C2H2-type zinc finger protein [Nitrosotalea sp.]